MFYRSIKLTHSTCFTLISGLYLYLNSCCWSILKLYTIFFAIHSSAFQDLSAEKNCPCVIHFLHLKRIEWWWQKEVWKINRNAEWFRCELYPIPVSCIRGIMKIFPPKIKMQLNQQKQQQKTNSNRLLTMLARFPFSRSLPPAVHLWMCFRFAEHIFRTSFATQTQKAANKNLLQLCSFALWNTRTRTRTRTQAYLYAIYFWDDKICF